MGLEATNVVGCLPSTIVDISPQRSGTAGRPLFGRIREFHMRKKLEPVFGQTFVPNVRSWSDLLTGGACCYHGSILVLLF